MNDFLPPGHFDALATGRTGQDQFAKLVAVEQEKIDGAQQAAAADAKVAAFINSQQGAIKQPEAGAVDQQALQFLQSWRRENPKATSTQMAVYEKDLASVLAGRRYGETPEAFNARMQSGEPAAPADQQQVDSGLSQLLPDGVEAVDVPGLNRVLDAAETLGVDEAVVGEILQAAAQTALQDDPLPTAFTGESFSMFDYVLNPADIGDGFELDRHSSELNAVCREARQRGISQQQLMSLMRSYFAEAS